MKTYAYYIVFNFTKVVTDGKKRTVHTSTGSQEIVRRGFIRSTEDVYAISELIRNDRSYASVTIVNWREMAEISEAAMKHLAPNQACSEDEKTTEGCMMGVEELKPTGGNMHKDSGIGSIESYSQDKIKNEIFGEGEERAKEGVLPLMTGDEVKYRLGVLSGVRDRELFLYLGGSFSGLFQLYENQYYSINNKGILNIPTVFEGDPQVFNFGEICREGFRSVIYITVLDYMEKSK